MNARHEDMFCGHMAAKHVLQPQHMFRGRKTCRVATGHVRPKHTNDPVSNEECSSKAIGQ